MRKVLSFLFFAVVSIVATHAQVRDIRGIVLDAVTDEPLVGVSIVAVDAPNIGTITNIDGEFILKAPATVTKARVSYIGYETQVVSLVPGVRIYLKSQSNNLDEVVVVAYGQQKRSSLTGSVSQVSSAELEKRPVTSVTSALEGATTGITVSANYGEAGSAPTIIVRGIGTVTGSTSPLYVIDGVPFGGNISDLNADDIESISVLKDAASTALYGNRASNGVILITTKKAKNRNNVSMTFRTNQGWYERGIDEYDRLNAKDWMNAQYQTLLNNQVIGQGYDRTDATDMAAAHSYVQSNMVSNWLFQNPWNVDESSLYTVPNIYSAAAVFNQDAELLGTIGEDTDWWDQATRKGYRGEYQLSGMGATDKSDYIFSLSYLNEDGYMRDNSFERFTGRAAINMQPTTWLKSGFNILASHQKNHGTMNGVGDGSSSYNNAFYFCRYMSPIYPVHEHDLTTGEYVLNGGEKVYSTGWQDVDGKNTQIRNQNSMRNVVYEQQVNTRQTIRNTVNATAYADIILPYGLDFKVQGNLNTRNSDYYNYQSSLIGDATSLNGALAKTLYTYKNYTFQQQLNWQYVFDGRHHVNAILGHENFEYRYDYTYAKKTNQALEGLTALSNFSTMSSVSGYKSGYRTESFLGRVQYNYDDRYNAEVSFRRDGSSRFASGNRWGSFWGAGANWVFSKEAFLEDVKWLNSGKLYVNWGQVGNDAGVDYYAYQTLYALTAEQNQNALYLSLIGADELKWETAETFGLGLEAWLFDRMHMSVEYYNKNTKDLIFNVSYPSSGGSFDTSYNYPTIPENIGTIRNRGLEVAVDVDVFRNKDWKVNVGAQLSTNQNRVTKLPDQYKTAVEDLRYNQDGELTKTSYTGYYSGIYRIQEGHSRYDINYYHWEGVDMMDGMSLYTPDLEAYYIKTDDGTIIGGTYIKNDNGELVLDTSNCTQLSASNYRLINGKYYVINTTYAAKEWAGDALPKVYGSFSGSVKWKNLTVSAMFTYSLGGKVYDSNYASLMSAGSSPAALSVDVLNCWTERPEGMTETSADRIRTDINPLLYYGSGVETSMWGTATSSPTSSYQSAGSDRWLVSRNYLCFKNLNFAYEIPKTVLRKVGVKGMTVSFSGENLFIKTARKGMNPMMSISGSQSNYLVPARIYTFGLTMNI